MAFIKRDVKDRVVQYPRRYQLVEVQPGIFDLIPVTGTVTEEGTPINKAYLQPIEDGLDVALEKTGDGKDVIVTFTEAAIEAHITSGEKLSVMFGKILKMFKGKAPNSHTSSGTTYGVGTTANYGHCKTINGLTQSSHVNGNALSAYQGKVLNDKIQLKADGWTLRRTFTFNLGSDAYRAIIPLTDFDGAEEIAFRLRGNISATATTTTKQYINFPLYNNSADGGASDKKSMAQTSYSQNFPLNIPNISYFREFYYSPNWRHGANDLTGHEIMEDSSVSLGINSAQRGANAFYIGFEKGTGTVSGTVYIDLYVKEVF